MITTSDLQSAILGSPRSTCPACGALAGPWEIDHKHPRSRGGLDTKTNKWVICRSCNRSKGTRTSFEFLRDLKKEARQ